MEKLLQFTDHGIYCAQADVYIDPWKPVSRALITHGHADHARWGHQHYLCHTLTAAIILKRISPDLTIQTVDYNEPILINGVRFTFHPAGHIIGSAQIRVEYKGEIWVASGDYKNEDDGISTPLEIIRCHTFITESTFGLPIYAWQPQANVFDAINNWWRSNIESERPSIIYGYSLGKAQRIIQHLDHSIGPVYTHGAVENMNEVFREAGIVIKPTERIVQDTQVKIAHKGIIVAPPGAFNSTWTRKFKNAAHAACSGWMTLRGARRRKGVDRGFILSDHADWKGLNDTIDATGAENVITTHGYTNTFVQWLRQRGLNAQTENTAYTGESLDEVEQEVA